MSYYRLESDRALMLRFPASGLERMAARIAKRPLFTALIRMLTRQWDAPLTIVAHTGVERCV